MKITEKNISEQKRGLYQKVGGGNEWRELGEKGKEQVLSNKEILKLAKLVKKIEDHYSTPQDIEWAQDKSGKFYITQSRPITTLKNDDLVEVDADSGVVRILEKVGDRIIKKSSKKEKNKTVATHAKTEKKRGKKSGAREYKLHFSGEGFNILLLDMIFNSNTYGAVDYIVFYENGINRAYLSSKGVRESYLLSKKILNDDFYNNLIDKSKKLLSDLSKYSSKMLNSKNACDVWNKTVSFNDEFCEIYRFYEQPFQQALEMEILKRIEKDKLINFLSNNEPIDKISDAETRKHIERLIEMGHMKLKIHDASVKFATSNNVEKYISEKAGLPLSIVGAMRKQEVREVLCNKKMSINVSEFKKRLKGCVFVKEDGKWNLYTGKKYKYWKNKVQDNFRSKIIGDIAYRGIATGRVVIHLSWTGTTDMRKGDVLVTGMTNPQMIPFIKKASAIVTDEGGIACHAAIIARELKKPCIVGTGNATQVLQDGDLVEVDADKGVVRILEKVEK